MTQLAGKVALITGAASGIGRAAAVMFAEAGARVALTDLDKAGLEGSRTSVTEKGGEAIAVAGDITDPATSGELAERAATEFGRVDVLLNNVGILIMKSLAETTVADFEALMRVNCLSHLLSLQAAVPYMKAAGGGSVINVASVGGLVALPNVSAYGASKSAVLGLTRAAAVEFAPDIRVNAICPGGVDTPMAQRHLASFEDKEAAIKQLTGRQLIKRYARPEEIAAAALFLATDASSFITGAVLPVEAGHTAW
jgi:NAD(P)-dependent dehydrogenase (short-subunit alcohol dehydrogenase family)